MKLLVAKEGITDMEVQVAKELTLEQKKYAIYNYCEGRESCLYKETGVRMECPLFERNYKFCSKGFQDNNQDEVEAAYNILVEHGEIEPPVEYIEEPEEEVVYDPVTKPEHYCHGSMETLDEMVAIFGVQETMCFCKLNAWKYRARALYKGNPEQDMEKADFYLQKYVQLKESAN